MNTVITIVMYQHDLKCLSEWLEIMTTELLFDCTMIMTLIAVGFYEIYNFIMGDFIKIEQLMLANKILTVVCKMFSTALS